MQRTVLQQHPSAHLQVYATWLPMLGPDSRSAWDGSVLSDFHVKQYWDEQRIVGQWFAQNVNLYRGTAWDVYYLYGPEATWDTVPGPLIGTGNPIIAQSDTLEAQIAPLLQP